MTLLAVFAALALALAAAGIYGVTSHLVALRTPEIGMRLVLGAKPASVMRQILEPTDPITLASVGVSLMFVALLAVAVPALRAMRVDPVTALRN